MSASVNHEERANFRRSITQDDLVFLKELQQELSAQMKFLTDGLHYWVIVDYEYREAAASDEIDLVGLIEDDKNEIMSLEEAVARAYREELEYGGEQFAKDWLEDQSLEIDGDGKIKSCIMVVDATVYMDAIKEHFGKSALACLFLTKQRYIVPNIMFLTQREAKEYLKAHSYNYTNEAEVREQIAWHSPTATHLCRLLYEVDFNELSELVAKGEKEHW